MTWKSMASFVVGDERWFSVQARLFNVTCLIYLALAVFYAVIVSSIVSEGGGILTLVYIAGALTAALGYIYSRVRKRFEAFVTPLWFIGYFVFPATWFIQGGSHGTAAFVMFPSITALLIVDTRRIAKHILTSVAVLMFVILLFVGELHPELVHPYPSEQARFFDFLSTLIPSLILMAIITNYFVGNYQRVSQRLQTQNQRIERLTTNLRRYLPSQLVDSLEKTDSDYSTTPQRKRITVFFSDIRDFTRTTDALQPEDLTQLLNEYLTQMTLIATEWGGTIDKFVGDAMMVFFGAPENRGDQVEAVSCVKMAIEMQQRMKALRRKWYEMGIEKPLEIRVGINTGVAAVGDFGAHERLSYTAIGGEVNLASRLEGICEPGGIVISHPTWALVKEEIKCARRDDKVTVKGIGHELTVYDVLFT